ncbi:MAG: DUF2203 domain-containing protein, partial [Planctomycetaceae bacterium]
IVALYHDVHERRERLARIRRPGTTPRNERDPYDEEIQEIQRGLEQDISRLQEYVDELTSLGIELKDPITGLIDFPTRIDGREAYLCWKMDEEEIGHWHELDTGFAGRQSLYESSTSLTGDDAEDESA